MAEIIQYKCPYCDGRVEFNSSTQNMKCPYCDSEFTVDEASIEKESNSRTVEDENAANGLKTYVCKSCGGEIVTDENTSATVCPFCENPIVLLDKVSGEFLPEQIIPFKVSKEMAKKFLLEHYKDKPYLPDMFSDENHLDEIKGVYVPYWVYNSSTITQINCKCRKNTTHRRNAKNGYYIVTDSAVFDVMRKGRIFFKNVPVDASKKLDDKMMDSIEPFDFNGAVRFDPAYLSGFSADKYDETCEDLKNRVENRIKDGSVSAMYQFVNGYDTKSTPEVNISFAQTKNPYYMLCPVWILNTTFEGQNYRFAVNGQTGKIVGKLPIDSVKKRKIFVKDFAVAGSIAAAAGAVVLTAIQLLGGVL